MATFYHYYAAMKIVTVRLPDDLHALVRQQAERDRRSLNAEILHLLERGLDHDDERHWRRDA